LQFAEQQLVIDNHRWTVFITSG